MMLKTVDSKRRKRVPFSPKAFLCHTSLRHVCRHFFLPEKGTVLWHRLFLLPEKPTGSRPKRAAFCAFSKASMTVEAAFVLPLFFLCIICMFSITNIYGQTLSRMAQLRDTVMAAALLPASTEEEKMVDIGLPLSFSPLYLPEGAASKLISCRACMRAWNGRDDVSEAEGKSSTVEFVYVTDYMSVYHTSASCTHLDLSIRGTSAASVEYLHNDYGQRYHACEKCAAAGCGPYVYITSNGDCYHSSSDCAGLKRTVRMVDKRSLDASLCQCQRCAAKAAGAAA